MPDVDGCTSSVGNDGDCLTDDDGTDRTEPVAYNTRRRAAKERDHGDEKSEVELATSSASTEKTAKPGPQQVEINIQQPLANNNGQEEHDEERGYETCDSGLSNSTSSEDSVPEAERVPQPLPDPVLPTRPSSSSAGGKKQRYPSLHLPSVGRSASPGDDSSRQGSFAERNRSSDSLGSNISSSSRSRTRSKAQRRKQDGQKSRHALNKAYKSIISSVFDGKLMSSVQCLTCGQVS
jgi:hypothetical protein